MSIGPLVSIKRKGNSMCISDKTEICPFVHNYFVNKYTQYIKCMGKILNVTDVSGISQISPKNVG